MSPKGSIRQAYSSSWVNWARSMCLHSPRVLPERCSSPRAMTSSPRPSYVHHALRDPAPVFVAAHGEVGIGRALHLHTGLLASHVDALAARREGEPRLREGRFQTGADAAHPHVRLVRVELPMTLRVFVHSYDNARVRIAYPYGSVAAPRVVAGAPTQGHENAARVPGR